MVYLFVLKVEAELKKILGSNICSEWLKPKPEYRAQHQLLLKSIKIRYFKCTNSMKYDCWANATAMPSYYECLESTRSTLANFQAASGRTNGVSAYAPLPR